MCMMADSTCLLYVPWTLILSVYTNFEYCIGYIENGCKRARTHSHSHIHIHIHTYRHKLMDMRTGSTFHECYCSVNRLDGWLAYWHHILTHVYKVCCSASSLSLFVQCTLSARIDLIPFVWMYKWVYEFLLNPSCYPVCLHYQQV